MRFSTTTSKGITLRLLKLLILSATLAVVLAIPASADAHLLKSQRAWNPTYGTGCFVPELEFGEGGGRTIHMYARISGETGGNCGQTTELHTTTGTAQLRLMKYTGSGPYAGGYSICASWNMVKSDGILVSRHVDASVSCGSGYYAAAVCTGPTGYSSTFVDVVNATIYSRNCSSSFTNWLWSPDWHGF